MPPFLMLIAVVFVVIMVMMGNNPMDKIRAEQQKYGKDPLAREINKFNEEKMKKGASGSTQYKPPPGSTVYRLPQSEALVPTNQYRRTVDGEEEPITPPPDIPIEQWGSQYPSYMYAPSNGGALPDGSIRSPRGGTSFTPGRN